MNECYKILVALITFNYNIYILLPLSQKCDICRRYTKFKTKGIGVKRITVSYHVMIITESCSIIKIYPSFPRKQKCDICRKYTKTKKKREGVKRINGASAGCAYKRCGKSFHYYCAKQDSKVITMPIKKFLNNGKELDLYRWEGSETSTSDPGIGVGL